MNKEERQKLLEELSKTNFGRALEDLLDEELLKIDTVDDITTLDEALGRQKSKKTLNNIFSFLQRRNQQGGTKKVHYN